MSAPLQFSRKQPLVSQGLCLIINRLLNIRPLEKRPIGTLLFLPDAIRAYSILRVNPFFSELLNLVTVGGLFETVLMAVFFKQYCYAVALELEDVPLAHFLESWIWDDVCVGVLVVCGCRWFEDVGCV